MALLYGSLALRQIAKTRGNVKNAATKKTETKNTQVLSRPTEMQRCTLLAPTLLQSYFKDLLGRVKQIKPHS